ncbi:MAG TPA: hypothetical protein P5556_04000 [Candidatus Gastranaerophilales bacterium]|nr:hypothetical protein [Candidatus Gastranaerophilales bacterium]
MKICFKKLTASCLSGIMITAMTAPVFAQNYQGSYTQDYGYNNYNQNYGNASAGNYNQNTGYAQPAANYNNNVPVQNNYNLPPLQGRLVVVPPGTMISGATTNRPLNSKNLRIGDRINLMMNMPLYYGGTVALPAGTNIIGNVVMAEAAGRAGKNGQLMIVFNQAITPSGQTFGFSGKIATEDGSGLLKGGTGMDRTKAIVKDTAVGAGSGALLGLIFSAISGGDKGKGAAIGTAIGGGTGVAKTVIDKGNDVFIQAGEALDIILDSELRVGGDQGGASPLPSAPSYYGY